MTTAYIIGNRKKFGAEREFKKAEKHLKNFFFEVFNPKEEHATVLMLADYDEKQAQKLFENYMLSCDMVFVLTGWELSSEATAELRLAEKNEDADRLSEMGIKKRLPKKDAKKDL